MIELTDQPEQWIYVDGPDKLHRLPWMLCFGARILARSTTKAALTAMAARLTTTLRGSYNENSISPTSASPTPAGKSTHVCHTRAAARSGKARRRVVVQGALPKEKM